MLPPLAVFLGLAGWLLQGRSFVFDLPLLASAHALSGPFADAVSMTFSRLGYAHGVIPTDVLLVVVSVWRRRWPAAAFATAALAGSGLLNMACKRFFARPRPALWESIAPESSFSFPSAHAMGSMTLATVLILLAWPGLAVGAGQSSWRCWCSCRWSGFRGCIWGCTTRPMSWLAGLLRWLGHSLAAASSPAVGRSGLGEPVELTQCSTCRTACCVLSCSAGIQNAGRGRGWIMAIGMIRWKDRPAD